MSFGIKDNGREFVNRTTSNSSKMQSINNRNINLSQQYSNSNNGENYSYDMKNQRGCNSPKQSCEVHSSNQQSNTRDHYSYKNDNGRPRHYPGKYSNDRPNYYNQRSNSPVDVVIPDIEQLKEFIREQSEQFKHELAKYEGRKSCSPSPRSTYHQDQTQQRSQQRSVAGQNRNMSSMSTSNSLGTISCSNSNFSNPSFASTAMSNVDKSSNMYQSKSNYNKPAQSSGKSSNLTRNLSHEETFSKAPLINKNRVSSPNNISEKSSGNKSQYVNTSNVGGTRQENKSEMNKTNKYPSYSFSPGNYLATSQQNTNNSVTAFTYASKINNQARPNMNPIVNNIKTVTPNSYDNHKNSVRMNGDLDPSKGSRVEVRVPDNVRHLSNSGNTTDSQDIEYGTPDSPTSPSSLRSPHTDEIRNGIGSRHTKKAL